MTWQNVAVGVAALGVVVSFLVGVDKTYARRDRTIQTFDQLEQKVQIIQMDIIKEKKKTSLESSILFLTVRKFSIKDLVRKYPYDDSLKEDLKEIQKTIDKNQETLSDLNK